MIPLYAVSQVGGKIYSMDDSLGVNDFMALDGSGGSPYIAYFLSTLLPLSKTLGFADLRKYRQRFDTGGSLTIAATPWRDGRNTGQTITRTFATGGVGITSTPLFGPGSDFQLYVQLTGFTQEVQLSNASLSYVPRRRTRGVSALG